MDGLGRHQHVVVVGGQRVDQLAGGTAAEVGVLELPSVEDRRRIDTVEVLQVGADVGEPVLDRLDVAHPGDRGHVGDGR